MPFRLRLTEVEDPMSLEFDCTIGYIEYLRIQLQGCQQPILPCLVFKIQSFNTLGPRLDVYLNGTPYDGIGVGNLGDYPDGYRDYSSDPEVENAHVGLTLEVDDKQLIELHSIYQAIEKDENPPFTWATTVPKEVVQLFDRQANLLNRKLKEALYERVPRVIECLHCGEQHSRTEVDKYIKTRPRLRYLQSEDGIDPSRILITVRCPVTKNEIEVDSG